MKSISTLILAIFLLIPLQAQDKVYTVDNLPKVHLQNKMQYVCNPAGILSQAACDTIDSMLLQSPNQKIPDRKTKCVIETHLNIKQNVIFGANLKPV